MHDICIKVGWLGRPAGKEVRGEKGKMVLAMKLEQQGGAWHGVGRGKVLGVR